jgi:hypothetical protein
VPGGADYDRRARGASGSLLMQAQHRPLDPFERQLMAAIVVDLLDCATELCAHAGSGSEAAHRLERCANFLGASFPEVRAEAARLQTATDKPRDDCTEEEQQTPARERPTSTSGVVHATTTRQSSAGDAQRSMSPISEPTVNALIQPKPGALISSGM